MSMLNNIYEKEFDPETDRWFYVNKVCGAPLLPHVEVATDVPWLPRDLESTPGHADIFTSVCLCRYIYMAVFS